ncbi:TatD family hydrolase [Pediococcus siamensis]|uniref:TatD family hydrolase n=1 Tax=Pediococcus siamensis TaxID=381829 RepID=UPI0039A1961D
MQLFDSHTHLNDPAFKGQEEAYLAHAHKLGVAKLAMVGSNAEFNAAAIALAHRFSGVYAVVGWHPEDAKNYHEPQAATLREQLQDPQVVALGEIGLDYYETSSPRKIQRRVFEAQLELASELKVPVAIHNRDAFEDTYAILKNAHVETFGGVMHSFNGNPEWLDKFLALGMHISYSGVASYNSAHEVHQSVRQTPSDRLMAETDAPYLAPVPFRGKQNEPAYTLYVVETLARLRDEDPDLTGKLTYENAKAFYRISDHEKN